MRKFTVVSAVLALAMVGYAQENLLPNPSFEEGARAPEGWTPASDACSWSQEARTGARSLAVTGDGSDTTYWRTDDPGLEAGQVYEFSVWTRAVKAGAGQRHHRAELGEPRCGRGCGVGAHRAHLRATGARRSRLRARRARWHAQGTILFDDAAIVPVSAVPLRRELALGEGEAWGREYLPGPARRLRRQLLRVRCIRTPRASTPTAGCSRPAPRSSTAMTWAGWR